MGNNNFDSYGYGGFPAYVSVAERKKKIEKAIAKAGKGAANYAPVLPTAGALVKTAWGRAWCSNLECYSDYATRLPRGRSYLRHGAVVDMQLSAGEVRAKVQGGRLYNVNISIAAVVIPHWRALCRDCAGSIDSLVELLQGKLAKPVMERICQPGTGLFPVPGEIRFSCSCPDDADMCKHVAAVLYGVGVRFDTQPELLFLLRKADAADLVAQATSGLASGAGAAQPGSANQLEDSSLADLFGLDMADDASVVTAAAATAVAKHNPKPASVPKVAKSVAKKPAAKKAVAKKVAVKKVAKKTADSPAVKLKAMLAKSAALEKAIEQLKKSPKIEK